MKAGAGIGLANQPNHNAILYDPTKSVNQLITRLANTAVDCLYHNEAILLQGGHVLVFVSGPEDDPNLQES